MKERLYTVDETASILELHPRTIRRFIHEGRLTARKVGKQWRISESALDELAGFAEGGTVNESAGSQENEDGMQRDGESPDDRHAAPGGHAESADAETGFAGKIRASTVIDIAVTDEDEAWRLSSTVIAVLNGKEAEYGEVRFESMFLDDERKVRFMLWGDARFIGNLLVLLSQITSVGAEDINWRYL